MPSKVPSDYVELSVARKKGSMEARLLQYLKASKKGGGEMVMEAIIPRYLPYMLYSEGVRGEELYSCVLDAIGDLEAEIVKLKRAFGMEGLATVVLVQPYGGASSMGATGVQPAIGSGGMGAIAAANLVPPGVSFFGSNEPSPVESPVGNESVSADLDEEDDDDDDFFNDDEDDPIARAEIEVDAGFRLG